MREGGAPPTETVMYKNILVTLDATPTDRAILEHVKPLAKMMSSHVVLLHVADGLVARWYGPDAVSREVADDTAYLSGVCEELTALGIEAETELAYGDPVTEIVRWVRERRAARAGTPGRR